MQHLQVSAGCRPAQSTKTPACMSPRPTVSLKMKRWFSIYSYCNVDTVDVDHSLVTLTCKPALHQCVCASSVSTHLQFFYGTQLLCHWPVQRRGKTVSVWGRGLDSCHGFPKSANTELLCPGCCTHEYWEDKKTHSWKNQILHIKWKTSLPTPLRFKK